MRRVPTADGDRAKRLVQNPSLMTTAAGPPSRSSSGVNVRPMAGRLAYTSKKRGSTSRADSRSGAGPLVSVVFSLYQPEIT